MLKVDLKNMNLPDWLSIYRAIAGPILLVLISIGQREIFTWLLLISYSTDMLDGFIARRRKITSARGSVLDSVGDQITFVVAFIGLLVFETQFISQNYLPIVLLFLLYGIQMLLAFRKYGRLTSFHTYLAKLSALLQGIFILWLLFFNPVYWLFYAMIIVGLLETLEEITLIFICNTWASDIKGIYWVLNERKAYRNNKTIP